MVTPYTGRGSVMRHAGIVMLLSVIIGCYPTPTPVTIPTYIVIDPIDQSHIDAGLKACTELVNDARNNAALVHRRGFVSRRVSAVTTVLTGAAATAASAAGLKDLATALSATTVLGAVVTAALVDETQTETAEANQTKALGLLEQVRLTYRAYASADDERKPAAKIALIAALVECGYTPQPALTR